MICLLRFVAVMRKPWRKHEIQYTASEYKKNQNFYLEIKYTSQVLIKILVVIMQGRLTYLRLLIGRH